MNVVPLERITQMMDQRINSVVYGKVITQVAQSVEWLIQPGDRRLDPAQSGQDFFFASYGLPISYNWSSERSIGNIFVHHTLQK